MVLVGVRITCGCFVVWGLSVRVCVYCVCTAFVCMYDLSMFGVRCVFDAYDGYGCAFMLFIY